MALHATVDSGFIGEIVGNALDEATRSFSCEESCRYRTIATASRPFCDVQVPYFTAHFDVSALSCEIGDV